MGDRRLKDESWAEVDGDYDNAEVFQQEMKEGKTRMRRQEG